MCSYSYSSLLALASELVLSSQLSTIGLSPPPSILSGRSAQLVNIQSKGRGGRFVIYLQPQPEDLWSHEGSVRCLAKHWVGRGGGSLLSGHWMEVSVGLLRRRAPGRRALVG